MSELQVEPQVLAEAGRSLIAERSALADAAAEVTRALGTVAAALPGSRTATAADHAAALLASEARATAVDLGHLGRALTTAAREYGEVERSIVTGIERSGRAA
ncbi:MAG TPA: hypothetical protein VGP36_15540 [Mycobacteriales bacterium]|jgi:hypothetical protein|nr:hypothetical protein [Mycobacteriales bacterium]